MSYRRQLRNTYGNSDLRHMQVDVEGSAREAEAGARRADEAIALASQRIEHPVITDPRWTSAYRVDRRVRSRDGLHLELIGETNSLPEALEIARREQWAAIITDDHGKQVHFNWQPERRRA